MYQYQTLECMMSLDEGDQLAQKSSAMTTDCKVIEAILTIYINNQTFHILVVVSIISPRNS